MSICEKHNTNAHNHTCARQKTHFTLICMCKQQTDTKAQTHLHTHSYTANTFTQVMMAGPAQHAALESTSLFAQVLSVAYVPSTPTRLLLARVQTTANATQATQVKMSIRDKHDTTAHNHTCTTPKYKYAHVSSQHTRRN